MLKNKTGEPLLPFPSEDANNSCMISSATNSATISGWRPCVVMNA